MPSPKASLQSGTTMDTGTVPAETLVCAAARGAAVAACGGGADEGMAWGKHQGEAEAGCNG